MKLFTLNKVTYEVEIAPEALLLEPFKRLVDRDKSPNKTMAKKELAFLYHYCDVRSDYVGLSDSNKLSQVMDNLMFPKGYKLDKYMQEAISLYRERSKTVIQILYEGAVTSAQALNKYLLDTERLLEERTSNGGKVTSVPDVANALKSIPDIMSKLKTAEKELIKEQKETEGRMKGSKEMGMYEGTNIFNID